MKNIKEPSRRIASECAVSLTRTTNRRASFGFRETRNGDIIGEVIAFPSGVVEVVEFEQKVKVWSLG